MRRMSSGHALGASLPAWSILPFAGILLSIALMPLLAPHVWHRHYPKFAAGWAVVFAVPFLVAHGSEAWHEIAHIYLADYLPFIILLWGLFTVAGGIVVGGTLHGTPALNTGILLLGTAIASFTGTTGAAMLLVRPILRANAHRKRRVHIVVFFIFLVANIGGSLTPLGDPPLFLGFLHGVPFFWTLHLLPHLAVAAVVLLCLFYLIDRWHVRREAAAPAAGGPREPLRVQGLRNVPLLLGILGGVLLSGLWRGPEIEVLGVGLGVESLLRDAIVLLMGGLSIALTPRRLRETNAFSWEPIREVAWLFAGIFMTIIPALLMLKAGEAGPMGWLVHAVQSPAQFFWVTGILSSFLDNAPTYLTYFNTLLGRHYPGIPEAQAVARLVVEQKIALEAIAVGAVFMGANTYIGNAPNLMVRSIAEEAGVGMPSFFGYVLRFTVPILLPLFLLIGLLFYQGV
jgi:Na+/H+ antiporter NhaD/arsenite permease-like protein